MEIGKNIYDLEKLDKKPYLCKIIDVNVPNERVRVHFVGWSESHDEWLSLNSDRIVENPSDQTDDDEKKGSYDIKCQELIGKLMRKANEIQKKVISVFIYKDDLQKNAKLFSKFQVPMLESTAELLMINIEDSNGKRLLKQVLIRRILHKLYAALPSTCSECNECY